MTKNVEREDVGGLRQESVFRKIPNRKGLNDVSSVHSPYNPGILGCGAGLSVLLQGRLPWSLGLQGRLQVLHKESILFKKLAIIFASTHNISWCLFSRELPTKVKQVPSLQSNMFFLLCFLLKICAFREL